jgi:hypothetical protein
MAMEEGSGLWYSSVGCSRGEVGTAGVTSGTGFRL